MGNMLTSWQQMGRQHEKLRGKVTKVEDSIRKRQEKSEERLIAKLSREMGIDLGKIVAEMEKSAEDDRESIKTRFNKIKDDVKHSAVQNRRRLDQAIKTYAKRGIIERYHQLYPNRPHLRMKYAHDWEGSCAPDSVPGMTGGASPPSGSYSSCDFFFDQELDQNGEPLVFPGHDGICNKLRAHCVAHAGDLRHGYASATATQTLIFRHDAPSTGPEAEYCGFAELWMPISLNGRSYAIDTDRVYVFPTLTTEGGLADIHLSIRIEQDTDHGPLLYPVTTYDRLIYSHYNIGGHWIFEGAEGVDWAPRVIALMLDEPYRLPPMTLLSTDRHGGGEVRVVVTLSCRATAINRHAEAEIDLASPGLGVEIHEVLLRGAGCVGTFSP